MEKREGDILQPWLRDGEDTPACRHGTFQHDGRTRHAGKHRLPGVREHLHGDFRHVRTHKANAALRNTARGKRLPEVREEESRDRQRDSKINGNH